MCANISAERLEHRQRAPGGGNTVRAREAEALSSRDINPHTMIFHRAQHSLSFSFAKLLSDLTALKMIFFWIGFFF
jgi:hypothetical protein